MRVLVTGATGFIGRHLCRALVARGDQVHALIRSPEKARVLPSEVRAIPGDLSLFRQEELELPELDVVVHLAGVVTARSLDQYKAINEDAVADLVGALERQRWSPRRLLFASSLAAAGPSSPGRPWTEADALQPVDPYGRAKSRAEDIVRAASFPTTSFRPPLVFGPEDPATLDLYQSGRRGLGVRVMGPPQQLSWVDIRDAVEALILLAEDERGGDHTYYLGSSQDTDIVQLWQTMGLALGRGITVLPLPSPVLWLAMQVATTGAGLFGLQNPLDHKQYTQMIQPAFCCSSALLQQELGWRPRHGLRESLEHAVEGYRAVGLLPQ